MERDESDQHGMEIADPQQEKRWIGIVTYMVFFALVAGVIVVLMRRFTGSLWLAIALVTFMVSYMLVMGWLASRNLSGSDGGRAGRWR